MSDGANCATEPLEADDERDDSHLEDVDVGAGCTEIWEHLAEQRKEREEREERE